MGSSLLTMEPAGATRIATCNHRVNARNQAQDLRITLPGETFLISFLGAHSLVVCMLLGLEILNDFHLELMMSFNFSMILCVIKKKKSTFKSELQQSLAVCPVIGTTLSELVPLSRTAAIISTWKGWRKAVIIQV